MSEGALEMHWVARARRRFAALASSPANYFAGFTADALGTLCCFVLAARHVDDVAGAGIAASGLVLGLCVGTFIEYGFHRWLFHAPWSFATAIHWEHHEQPAGVASLPFVTSTLGLLAFWYALSPLLDARMLYAFLGGLGLWYFSYGLAHDLQHRWRIPTIRWRWLRHRASIHALHHGRVGCNYGVTTSIWDRMLGTWRPLPAGLRRAGRGRPN